MDPHNLIWARVRTTFLRQIYLSIHPTIQETTREDLQWGFCVEPIPHY